jgi:glycosyltransferase involved in cell wall biosynthesis
VRVLTISQYFWPEAFRINDLVLGLQQRGHHVAVLTGKPNYPGGHYFEGYGFFGRSREDYHGIPVARVPITARGAGRAWQIAANYVSFVVSASLLGPWRCRGPYDAIFVFEPSPITVALPAILIARLKRIPVLLWVQDLWPESLSATGAVRSQFMLHAVGRLVRFIYRRCARVLVQSEGFEARVIEAGALPDRVHYFPNWAEDLYRPVEVSDAPTEGREMPEGFRLIFAGNVGAAQSFETILAAAERLKGYNRIRWVILGDGHHKKWVEEQVRRRGLESNVVLLGQRPLESMPRYFACADALLVTLKRDPIFALTVPSKIQSYLACGRPVLGALDGEGARVIERSGAGLTCPAEDPRALADAALALYHMPEAERKQMGERGRAYFEDHFRRDKLLSRLEAWLAEAAGEHRCAS